MNYPTKQKNETMVQYRTRRLQKNRQMRADKKNQNLSAVRKNPKINNIVEPVTITEIAKQIKVIAPPVTATVKQPSTTVKETVIPIQYDNDGAQLNRVKFQIDGNNIIVTHKRSLSSDKIINRTPIKVIPPIEKKAIEPIIAVPLIPKLVITEQMKEIKPEIVESTIPILEQNTVEPTIIENVISEVKQEIINDEPKVCKNPQSADDEMIGRLIKEMAQNKKIVPLQVITRPKKAHKLSIVRHVSNKDIKEDDKIEAPEVKIPEITDDFKIITETPNNQKLIIKESPVCSSNIDEVEEINKINKISETNKIKDNNELIVITTEEPTIIENPEIIPITTKSNAIEKSNNKEIPEINKIDDLLEKGEVLSQEKDISKIICDSTGIKSNVSDEELEKKLKYIISNDMSDIISEATETTETTDYNSTDDEINECESIDDMQGDTVDELKETDIINVVANTTAIATTNANIDIIKREFMPTSTTPNISDMPSLRPVQTKPANISLAELSRLSISSLKHEIKSDIKKINIKKALIHLNDKNLLGDGDFERQLTCKDVYKEDKYSFLDLEKVRKINKSIRHIVKKTISEQINIFKHCEDHAIEVNNGYLSIAGKISSLIANNKSKCARQIKGKLRKLIKVENKLKDQTQKNIDMQLKFVHKSVQCEKNVRKLFKHTREIFNEYSKNIELYNINCDELKKLTETLNTKIKNESEQSLNTALIEKLRIGKIYNDKIIEKTEVLRNKIVKIYNEITDNKYLIIIYSEDIKSYSKLIEERLSSAEKIYTETYSIIIKSISQ